MQPSAWSHIRRIAGKETTLFFTSPVAYLFLAAFGSVSFFAVFWGEAFFARNLADVRPLFEWMPLLLVFLCSAVTMKLWSEERRTGTLEHVLTTPVPVWQFVLGKFLACLFLLSAALLLTTPFPMTVGLLGDVDWGPVVAGYLAAFLLGASYLAIGLFVSSRTTNQIVSLLGSVAICGGLYLIGSPALVELFDHSTASWLQLLGTGSRFESITRGVVDLGSLAYYAGIILTFGSLNAFVLEAERWSSHQTSSSHSSWRLIVGLIVANAIGLSLWVGQLPARVDVTEGGQYSLSQATYDQIQSLQEPIQIKAYFSEKTHPLLAPLIPRLEDLLKEYEEVSQGKVRVDFIDPQEDPQAEQQAKQEYGIEPTPFEVADRFEASIVSSYFNIVLTYGDSYEVLGFQDLIEVKAHALNNIEVELRNPEYDITRTMKKVVDTFQQKGQLFETLSEPVTLQFYLSSEERMPEKLSEFRALVLETTEQLKDKSNGKLVVEILDPDSDESARQQATEYGFQPMASSLMDDQRFYFYMVLRQGDRPLQIPLADLTKASFEKNLNAGLKRFGSGFAKTVAMVGGTGHEQLKTFLAEELNIEDEDLNDGSVSGAADILLLLSPKNLTDKAVYALDQFLMRGGTVVVGTSPYQAEMSNQSLQLSEQRSGLDEWLKYQGITIEKSLVLDPQCTALPIPVNRYVQGHRVQTVQLVDYPYFIDVRSDGFAEDVGIFAELARLTVSWASPIRINKKEDDAREYVTLLKSSAKSWTSRSTDVTPQLDDSGSFNFLPMGQPQSHNLGVLVTGRFDSYFQDEERLRDLSEVATATLERSPSSARLLVISSPSMFNDQVIRLMSSLGAGDPRANLNLIANTIDWATQDESLLSIRSRSHFKRTLYPLSKKQQVLWELMNYGFALLILVIIGAVARMQLNHKRHLYQELLQS
jgi:gliding motility-associated transport system permease protein/gliding motility-associatede transport system auxiliary component